MERTYEKVCKETAALRAAVFSLFAKNLRGASRRPPPGPARVKHPLLHSLIEIQHFDAFFSIITYDDTDPCGLQDPGGPISHVRAGTMAVAGRSFLLDRMF